MEHWECYYCGDKLLYLLFASLIMAISQAHKSCPVCSRKINVTKSLKGDLAYEDTYCSRYCRKFEERKLEKVPFDGGNKHHKNKLRWPEILTPCLMCDKPTKLVISVECRNRAYCSKSCWNKLKSCQKRGLHRTMNILSLLEHKRLYHGDDWMNPSTISEICGGHGIRCSPTTVGLTLKRWRTAGIVDEHSSGLTNTYKYRFNLDGLKNMSVAQFVYNWNTMSYADRMVFTQS